MADAAKEAGRGLLSLVVADSAIREMRVGAIDRFVGMKDGYLFVELNSEARADGSSAKSALHHYRAAIEQIENPGIVLRRILLNGACRCRRIDVQRRHGADFALRIVRRHLDPVGFRQHTDLFQFENAAGVADVGLDVADEVAGAEVGETVLGEGAFAGGEGDLGFVAEDASSSP